MSVRIMATTWRFLASTSLLCVLSCGLAQHAAPQEGQRVTLRSGGAATVKFGMSVAQAIKALGVPCKAEIDTFFRPHGCVKVVRCHGLELQFDYDRLRDMEFQSGFDFKWPLTPFDRPVYNPPFTPENVIALGMAKGRFLEIVAGWPKRLTEAGFQVIPRYVPPYQLKSGQFTAGSVPYEDGRTAYCVSIVLPDHFCSAGVHCLIRWAFEFDGRGRLSQIWARDDRYSTRTLIVPR